MTIVQIITPYANQAAAIALSTKAGGVPESYFDALLTTDSTGGGAQPTHCWTNGGMDDDIIALFVADPTNYTVTYYPNRNPWPALTTHVPPLYAWFAS